MNNFIALLSLSALSGTLSLGQVGSAPKSNPSLPGYSGFHSNIGLQEIIEVGVPLSDRANGNASPGGESFLDRVDAGFQTGSTSQAQRPGYLLGPGGYACIHSTSNALRQESSLAKSSGVIESNAGFAVSHEAFKLNEYATMLPRLDLMMQWAWYSENSDLLDYQFGLIKGGVAFGFPENWSIGTSLDYNTLHNLDSGDKTFDSVSPSVSLQKIIPTSETSFFMFDSMVRWSKMDAETFFPAAGIFADSGNNYQTSPFRILSQNAGI